MVVEFFWSGSDIELPPQYLVKGFVQIEVLDSMMSSENNFERLLKISAIITPTQRHRGSPKGKAPA